MSQEFEMVIEIDAEGNVTATVNGVKGQACSKVSSLLDGLGEVTLDEHTPEWEELEPVSFDMEQDQKIEIGGGLW